MGSALLPMLWLIAFGPLGDEAGVAAGRYFYRTGNTLDQRRVEALMGKPPTSIPASVLPCQNCHGQRGYGRPEGGMIPANITWNVLTRPYALLTESGRRRPAYTIPTLIRAITQGIDSAGASLDPNMPRYQLDADQAAELIAWLRHMEESQDPGIGEQTIRIGLLGPRGTSPARMDAEAAWRAFAADLTARGGMYGRHLELVTLEISGTPGDDTTSLRDFVSKRPPFMLVMLGQTVVPPHVADFAHNHEIPLLGGRSLAPPPLFREVFYLYPGVGTHGSVLADYAKKSQGHGVAVILTRPGFEKGAEAIIDGCTQGGWLTRPQVWVLDPDRGYEASLARIVAQKPKFIFNMGLFDQEVSRLASMLTAANLQCTVLSPEALTTSAWLQASPAWKKLLVTTSLHAKDIQRGATIYGDLVRTQKLDPQPNPARLSSLAAAVLIQDALLACGRDLSRESMIRQLETKFRFETGFAPALSYNPNRRVGAEQIYLHSYDHQQRKTSFLHPLSLANSRDGL